MEGVQKAERSIRWPILLSVLLTLVIFFRVIKFPALDLDDPRHVFENPHLLTPTWGSLRAFWQGEYFSLYVPVTYSVWWLVSLISLKLTGRLSPAIFHTANLLLHLINIYLLSLVLKLLTQKLRRETTPLITCAALMLFAVHPWQAESVAWISSFRDILAISFSLLSLLYALRSGYVLGVFFFALALLSKPGTVFLVPWFFYAIWGINEDRRPQAKAFLAGTALMSVLLVLVTKMLQPDQAVADRIVPWLRPLTALDALGFFLKRFVWAGEYSLDYGRKPTFILSALPTLEFIAGASALGFVLVDGKWKKRVGATALLLAPLVPYLGLVPFQFQKFSTVAERYAYGLLLAAALALGGWGRSWLSSPRLRPWVWLMLLLWAGQLVKRVDLWSSNEKIFRQTVETNPRSLLGHTNLAYRLTQEGRGAEAIEHLRVSVSLDPKELYFRVALANLYYRGGDVGKAEQEVALCLSADPLFPPALAVQKKLADYRTQTRLRP